MKSVIVPLFTLLTLTFSAVSISQSVTIEGECSVKITGAHNFTLNGKAPAADGGRESKLSNILWIREYFAELRAKNPQAGSAYDNMEQAAERSGTFSLTCANQDGYLTISSLGYDLDPDTFAGKTGTYTLVGSSAKTEQPPGFMTGIVSSRNGALLSLSPDQKPGQLTITKFTKTEISGSFAFSAKGNNVSGDFAFHRTPEDG